MVCIYCGNKTEVTNSRLQRKTNTVWRRRRCTVCHAVFTSSEHIDYNRSIAIKYDTSHITPFDRDLLFLNIYDACKHRKTGVADASALTETILGKLLKLDANDGVIPRDTLVSIVSETLNRFDKAASVHYLAYHPYNQDY